DAVHETFARARERWDQYNSQRPLKGWLHGIVVHLALDQLRRRRVRRLALPVLGRATATLERTTHPDPADEVTRRQIVDRALDGLRPEVRATLVLRHYYGYDYAQIGTFLGISSGTVGSTLSRAHAAIRRRLQAEDPAAPEIAAESSTGAVSSSTTAARRGTSPEPPEVLP